MILWVRLAAFFPLNPPSGIGSSWIGRRIPVEGEGPSPFRQPRPPEVVPEGGGTREDRPHAFASDAVEYADIYERDQPWQDRLLDEARFGDQKKIEVLAHVERLGFRILSVPNDLVFRAVEYKAAFSMSFADCFALASAVEDGAVLVTGDPEFRAVEHLVTIAWV
jgi:ribonuclease VapC